MAEDTVEPCQRPAFGRPGIEPRWTRGAKDAVGTAYAASSRIWFTLAQGVVTEVYYPTVDRPQIRDLQFLISDGRSFFHDERRDTRSTTSALSPEALGYHVVNADPGGLYRLVKEIVTDSHQACLLIDTTLADLRPRPARGAADREPAPPLRLFALCAPHLNVGGWNNTAQVIEIAGRRLLSAHKEGIWLALAADVPFLRCSCGYVGHSDGWTDLADNFQMDWEFDCAADGNVALMGELDLSRGAHFTLGLALGDSLHSAANTLLQSLHLPFADTRTHFVLKWDESAAQRLDLTPQSGNGGALFHRSVSLLLAHEDKAYPGAFIASLGIPWGETKSDDDLGGYHLVWTRDMVKSATGLLAAGYAEPPHRALIYLATSQRADGGFYQNFWIDGRPYWKGEQLDETAFPILLAWRLHRLGQLRFDPYPMIMRATGFLIGFGPVTPEERWEECGGYSPSTLAAVIAALTCAAHFARERGDAATAGYVQSYADYVNANLEAWTVTTAGTLVPGIPRHYMRIAPVAPGETEPRGGRDGAVLCLANRPPSAAAEFPARDIVDGGFLELVRLGVRRAQDPIIEDSVRVIDAVLKVDTPLGPCWRRYNHDGYGQRDDGTGYEGWGRGRAWPLLTGERAHYELAAGRSTDALTRAIESFSHGAGLLPEQIWDRPDLPEQFLYFGRPTGSAMPLMWAHAEYLQLLRSRRDRRIFALIPEVAERYAQGQPPRSDFEFWTLNYPTSRVAAGKLLSIQAGAPFSLHWSADEWATAQDTLAVPTATGMHFVRVPIPKGQRTPVRFTFFWTETSRWEGKDFCVDVA